MGYRRLFLIFIAFALVSLPFIIMKNADAQQRKVFSEWFFPTTGQQFASRKDDGSEEFVFGSFDIRRFLLRDGNLVARGRLQGAVRSTKNRGFVEQDELSPRGELTNLPVEIKAASCSNLELLVGPPEGLMDPILTEFNEQTSNLSREHFCNIAEANLAGDNEALRDWLNTTGSCTLTDEQNCGNALGVCALSCFIIDSLCTICFAKLGEIACKNCL